MAISRRRLYILPTRNGALFALLLVTMLLGATNYSNNLAFALTFWLAAMALVSMHHAHANLVGLRIVAIRVAPVFCGATAQFEIALSHETDRPRRAVRVSVHADARVQRQDIGPGETARFVVDCDTPNRGTLRCPRLRIESVFPTGLFRAWSWLQPETQTLVYPQLSGSESLPRSQHSAESTRHLSPQGDEEFLGHRDYQPGDSPRRIDWKASARSDDLRIREYVDNVSDTLWLDEANTPGRSREARLSQLARWVMAADRAATAYGLIVGETRLDPDRGTAHRQACLRALALA